MILIVGSNKSQTATWSQQNGLGTSTLFTGTEFAPVCHSSFADCKNLYDHFDQFDQIYWADSQPQEFNNYQEYTHSIFLLQKCCAERGNVVIDQDLDPYHIKQTHKIKNTKNSIVFFGCSHTQGVGLDNHQDNYVYQISKHFGLDALNLSQEGKSNYRSFEQFNQTEFYSGQIVIFQLTDVSRLKFFANDAYETRITECQLQNISNRSYFDVYNDKQLIYQCINHLESILKYAREKHLKFVFFNMGGNNNVNEALDKESNKFKQNLEYCLLKYPEYVPELITKNIDRGNDGYHFGPQSHAIWTQEIIKKIKELYQ